MNRRRDLDLTWLSYGATTPMGPSPYLIQQWRYSVSATQLWQLHPVTYYNIVNRNSGLVLDIPEGNSNIGASTSNGTFIQLYQYLGGLNQQRQVVPSGN